MKKIISIVLGIFISLICFCLCFSFVNANLYWGQEANANYDRDSDGEKLIGYGSNYANLFTGASGSDYELCSITKSDYTPIVSNFGNLGSLKVVVTDLGTNKLSIYNPDCSLFREIYVVDDIIAMPVLMNPKSYHDQSIVVLTNDADAPHKAYLKVYHYEGDEYSLGVGDFVLTQNIFIDTIEAKYLTCFDYMYGSSENETCVVLEYQEGFDVIFFVIDMITEYINEIDINLHYGTDELFNYTGLSNIRDQTSLLDDEKFYIPLGFYGSHITQIYSGSLLRYINGTITEVVDYYGRDFDNNETDFKEVSSFIAQIGTGYYIFTYKFSGNETGNKYYSNAYINDLSGNLLIDVGGIESGTGTFDMNNISHKIISNWAIADYDKDGSNEACILLNVDGTEVWLQCYEPTLSMGDGDIRVNYSGLMDNVSNIVLADFIPSKNVLGIATRQGIFYPDDKVYSTSRDNSDFGYPTITFRDVYSKAPMYVYTDDDEGFIVTLFNITGVTCGNGICESPFENQLNCPQDCVDLDDVEGEFREGSFCLTDDDCEGNLKCEYGVCTKLTYGYECDSDSDCLSGECLNGYCTKASFWNKMDASKGQQFGDDSNTNNFIALFFMIAIAGFLGYYGNVFMGVGSFYILGIFFTIVGWLSVFILFGLILTGVIALVFGFMLKQEG